MAATTMPMDTGGALDAARWRQLAIIGFGELLALAPWFGASAVAPNLVDAWELGGLDLPILTVAVQLGFVAGALLLALTGAADAVSATRLFFLGASLAALANIGFALAGDFLGAIPFRVRDRLRAGGRLPGRHEAHRGLVQAGPRAGHRHPHRRADGGLGAALPLSCGRAHGRRRLAGGRRRLERLGSARRIARAGGRPRRTVRRARQRTEPLRGPAGIQRSGRAARQCGLPGAHVGALRHVDVDPSVPAGELRSGWRRRQRAWPAWPPSWWCHSGA